MADWSICDPIQKSPVNKKALLIPFKRLLVSSDGDSKKFKSTAKEKNRINNGNPNLELLFLKYQAENKTKGTIQRVLPSFKVTATSTASSPKIEAEPITDAVSWTASAT